MPNDNKIMHLSFKKILHGKLVQMASDAGVSAAEVIRRAIEEKHERYLRVKYGYKGSSSGNSRENKDAQADRINELSQMSDEELTAHLVDIGYFLPDGPYPENERFEAHERIMTEGGIRASYYMQVDPKTGAVSFKTVNKTWNELINDLKKLKKI